MGETSSPRPARAIPARILGLGEWTGGRVVPSRELLETAMPDRDPDRMAQRIGIRERRWAEPGTAVSEMAAEALAAALADAGLEPHDLTRILVTCSTGGDLLIPGAAVDVAHRLGIGDARVDAFDLANSCAGYMSGFELAARAVATGDGPLAVVAVEQFSRFIREAEPRCYVIFGDAAVATVLGPSEPTEPNDDAALVGWGFKILSAPGERIEVRHGGRTGQREFIDFGTLSSDTLTEQALASLEVAVADALARAGLTMAEVDWVLPHQPNGEMLARFAARLGTDTDKMFPIVDRYGSVGVAAVPLSLHALHRSGRARPGQHVLMASVGSGTVAGALVYRWGR